MKQQEDEKTFIELFYQLPDDIRLETVAIMIKLMDCYMKDDPAIALTYHDGYMHIHGYNVSVKDAKEIVIQLGQSFIIDKLMEKVDKEGVKH